jgi:hypothetical protein
VEDGPSSKKVSSQTASNERMPSIERSQGMKKSSNNANSGDEASQHPHSHRKNGSKDDRHKDRDKEVRTSRGQKRSKERMIKSSDNVLLTEKPLKGDKGGDGTTSSNDHVQASHQQAHGHPQTPPTKRRKTIMNLTSNRFSCI